MPELNHNLSKPIVFFDGGCPLCRREIAHYLGLKSAANLVWIDISTDSESLAKHQLIHADAMARLHVLDTSGNWQTGAWGFAELWSHLSGYRWLARLLHLPGLLPLLDRVYNVFARRRLRQRCNVENGNCNLPS